MTVIGDTLLYMGGGFATAPSITETLPDGSLQICHNPAIDVFGALVMDLEEMGVINSLYDQYLTQTSTSSCGVASDDAGTSKLDVKEMSGIFFIHLGVAVFAILWRAAKLYCKGSKSGEHHEPEDEAPSVDDMLKTLLAKVENIEEQMGAAPATSPDPNLTKLRLERNQLQKFGCRSTHL